MFDFEGQIPAYLNYCKNQKGLNEKTLKAYRIDLSQFFVYMMDTDGSLTKINITNYITLLHQRYKPKSVKRKIASMKAFFNYLAYEEVLSESPLTRIKVQFKEAFVIPRTIPLASIEKILAFVYHTKQQPGLSNYQYHVILRNIAVLEMLFATGIRVSELCSLKAENVDLNEGVIKIFGKGSKERMVQIGNQNVIVSLRIYQKAFSESIQKTGCFFINRLKHRLSEQSVRFMINNYVEQLGIGMHITPHMFRHSFATYLLEEDVDIKYIQQLLGHSSIITTQIYTHVASKKQKDILLCKHPRNKFNV